MSCVTLAAGATMTSTAEAAAKVSVAGRANVGRYGGLAALAAGGCRGNRRSRGTRAHKQSKQGKDAEWDAAHGSLKDAGRDRAVGDSATTRRLTMHVSHDRHRPASVSRATRSGIAMRRRVPPSIDCMDPRIDHGDRPMATFRWHQRASTVRFRTADLSRRVWNRATMSAILRSPDLSA